MKGTNLIGIFQFLSTPLNSSVCGDQNDELSAGRLARRLPDLEGLRVESFLQRLDTDEVLELEITNCGPTLAELLDEALEAEADSLTSQEAAILDLSSHVLWQEGLVTGKGREDFCQPDVLNFFFAILII